MRVRGWKGRFSERRDRQSGLDELALLRMGSILFRVTLSCFGRSRPTASGPALLRVDSHPASDGLARFSSDFSPKYVGTSAWEGAWTTLQATRCCGVLQNAWSRAMTARACNATACAAASPVGYFGEKRAFF